MGPLITYTDSHKSLQAKSREYLSKVFQMPPLFVPFCGITLAKLNYFNEILHYEIFNFNFQSNCQQLPYMPSIYIKIIKGLCLVEIAVIDLKMLLFYMIIWEEKFRTRSITLSYLFCYCLMNC